MDNSVVTGYWEKEVDGVDDSSNCCLLWTIIPVWASECSNRVIICLPLQTSILIYVTRYDKTVLIAIKLLS